MNSATTAFRTCSTRLLLPNEKRGPRVAERGLPGKGSQIPRSTIPAVDVLLVSPDPESRELMALGVRSLERRLGVELRFRAAKDGALGIKAALRDRPDIIVADEIASHAGAFALAKRLRDDVSPTPGSS